MVSTPYSNKAAAAPRQEEENEADIKACTEKNQLKHSLLFWAPKKLLNFLFSLQKDVAYNQYIIPKQKYFLIL